MGEVIVFFCAAGATLIIVNERIKKEKHKDDEAFDPMFGRMVAAGSKNNLSNFIRIPNKETKLLISNDSGLFDEARKHKMNEMKLKAKIKNPFWLMNPYCLKPQDGKAHPRFNAYGHESTQMSSLNKWC